MMYYIRCPDGQRWRVNDAVSLKAAVNAITMARATGSVGQRDVRTNHVAGRPFYEWPQTVLADVDKVNSDNTVCLPYHKEY